MTFENITHRFFFTYRRTVHSYAQCRRGEEPNSMLNFYGFAIQVFLSNIHNTHFNLMKNHSKYCLYQLIILLS